MNYRSKIHDKEIKENWEKNACETHAIDSFSLCENDSKICLLVYIKIYDHVKPSIHLRKNKVNRNI